jgi:hypothetical protein
MWRQREERERERERESYGGPIALHNENRYCLTTLRRRCYKRRLKPN